MTPTYFIERPLPDGTWERYAGPFEKLEGLCSATSYYRNLCPKDYRIQEYLPATVLEEAIKLVEQAGRRWSFGRTVEAGLSLSWRQLLTKLHGLHPTQPCSETTLKHTEAHVTPAEDKAYLADHIIADEVTAYRTLGSADGSCD